MKLAQALVHRADKKKKLGSLRERIGINMMVEEGGKPSEDPAELIEESFGVLKELRILVGKINAANVANKLPDGRTLTEAMAERDELIQRHAMILHAIGSSANEPSRYSMREIKWESVMEVKALQRRADDLSRDIRELNLLIQETNWNTDLE